MRSVVSTWAFLLGLAESDAPSKTMLGVDLMPCDYGPAIALGERAGVQLEFRQGDSASIDLPPRDLLFIDTWHVYAHLQRELNAHHASTRRYIILHDTQVDAVRGEALRLGQNTAALATETGYAKADIERGLQDAIAEFLEAHKAEWRVERVDRNNNGLTVLARILTLPEMPACQAESLAVAPLQTLPFAVLSSLPIRHASPAALKAEQQSQARGGVRCVSVSCRLRQPEQRAQQQPHVNSLSDSTRTEQAAMHDSRGTMHDLTAVRAVSQSEEPVCAGNTCPGACPGGIFIDLGANRGDTAQRFFSGGHDAVLQEAARRRSGANAAAPQSFCVHSFEANPAWSTALVRVHEAWVAPLARAGGAFSAHLQAAVAPGSPSLVTLRVSTAADSAGTTIEPSKRIVGGEREVSVPTVDLVQWFSANVPTRARRGHRLAVLKIDARSTQGQTSAYLNMAERATLLVAGRGRRVCSDSSVATIRTCLRA